MTNPIYALVRFIFRISYRKPRVYGVENYDESVPAVFVCNHEKFYGPILAQTRFPIKTRTWANSMTTETRACNRYIAESLLMGEHGWNKFPAHLVGFLTGWFVSFIIRSAKPIVSYWDKQRSRKSIRAGVQAIVDGENQLLFSRRKEFTDGKLQFMKGYLFMCKLAGSKHGVNPLLYPVSFNRINETIAIGKPTRLDTGLDFEEESERVNAYLLQQVLLGYDNPELMVSAEAMEKASAT
ncbi:MAG TPA: hypothetical protein PLP30_09770 [Clostridia bacterium]|nr:hypothetical protein [Clostridia bacterium]